jgi:hypothetical protein
MPEKFKALASIAAWVLFVLGLLGIVMGCMGAIIGNVQEGFEEPPAIEVYIAITCGIISLTLSAVVMRLRQKME